MYKCLNNIRSLCKQQVTFKKQHKTSLNGLYEITVSVSAHMSVMEQSYRVARYKTPALAGAVPCIRHITF